MTLRAEKVKKALIALLVCLTAMSGFFVVETALADTAYATTYYTYGYSFKYYDVNNSLVTKTALTFKSSTKSTSSAVAVYNASQTRANCTFKGWSTNVAATSGATTVSNARNKKTKPTTSNTYGAGTTGHRYYAIWQPNWSLARSLGVAGAQESETLAVTARANPSYALTAGDLTDASATGYTFDGWYRDASYATAASAGQVIYNSATIYAKWIEKEYKVLFDGNGANSNVPRAAKRKYSKNYTIPDNIPTKLGSTFVCWNTKADGSGTDYMPGDTVSDLANTEKELKLFAKWNMHVDLLTTEALTLQASDVGEIAGSKFYILNQSDFNVRCKELSFVPENGWTCVETTEDMPKDSKKIGLKCTSLGGHEMKTPITDVLITDEETKGFRFVGKAALSNKGFIRERVGTMMATLKPEDAAEETKTILYSDGTLIINEPVSIHSANMLIHGAVTAEYESYAKGPTWNSETTVPWVADTTNRNSIKHVEFGSKTAPDNMAYWFYNCRGLESLDSKNLDTSKVTDMSHMFYNAGYNASAVNLDLSGWNTANVTDMSAMFIFAGYNATTWDIGDLSGWNTANVTNMNGIFQYAGYNATTFDIGDIGGWDTAKVTNMYSMFCNAGYNATTFDIGDLSGWDVSNVPDMSHMFDGAGKSATTFDIGDLSGWDTANVTTMSDMFRSAGYNASAVNLDLSGWNTANVKNMSYMFSYAGYNADAFELDLSGWDVSNVINTNHMFDNCRKLTAIHASSDWNHSGLSYSTSMFEGCTSLVGGNGTAYDANNVNAAYAHPDANGNPGYFTYKEYAPNNAAGTYLYSDGTLVINELASQHSANVSKHGAVTAEYPEHTSKTVWSSSTTVPWVADTTNRESIKHVEFGSRVAPQFMSYWFYNCKGLESLDSKNLDTSKVTNMSYMFYFAGYKATTFNLDIGGWDTANVANMGAMFYCAGYSAKTFDIGDLSGWNTAKVTDMSSMFYNAGYKATTWDIGGLSGWNTSNVTRMYSMFENAGYNASDFNPDLSGWNTANVTDMSNMFENAGYNATTFDIGDIGGWDTAKVTNMYSMFASAGKSATTWDIGNLGGWNTSKVTETGNMFASAGYNADTFELDFSGWDLSNVTNMNGMFYNCRKVSAIYASSDWNHSGLSSSSMFDGCTSLVGGNGTKYSSSNVTATYAHPDTSGNPGYFTYKKNEKPEGTKEKAAGTYLYSDGTLVINELASKHSANVSAHGSVVAEYAAYTEGTTWKSEATVPWVKDTTNRESIKKVEFGSKTAPNNMAYWFNKCKGLESLDSKNLDTANVTNMNYMFFYAGYNATTFNLDLSSWNTSKVQDMYFMLAFAGYSATTWDIGDLSGWNTAKVTRMNSMFSYAGYSATTWDIGDLSGWNTSNVTDMYGMFDCAGSNATTWNIGDISGWNTSKATRMDYMFSYAGRNATTWDIGDLSSWNTANVTDMNSMFFYAGRNATTWNIGDISSWDTSKVTNMGDMFESAGRNATTWDIGDISSWDTSKVTAMDNMFYYAGASATTYRALDLSGWDVSKVTTHTNFKNQTWITEPSWVQ